MAETTRTIPELVQHDDPWQLGWRYLRHEQPDGTIHYEQVPLQPDDLLHPEEGDQMTHSRAHQRIVRYLTDTFEAWLADDASAVVLDDVRIAWDVPGVRPHGPDVMVIRGVRALKNWSTFDVAAEGTRPLLIVEITSPDTRHNDLTFKLEHYERVGVPYYIIVDLRQRGEQTHAQLLGYQLVAARYQPIVPNERSWLWIELLGLWMGLEGSEVYLYDQAGQPLGDYVQVVRALSAAEDRAAIAEQRAAEETRSRLEAEQRAAEETRSRLEAEARLALLEAEVRRLRGETHT